ncbi:MAG TPA: CBS domain-containing protein [Aquifex aeolicus]|nr:CBS domain-containing protein [Aquifex aeolicus]
MVRKYFWLPVLIGLSTGIAAVLFVKALELITHVVLENLVGYYQPLPAGEGSRDFYTFEILYSYLLPFVVALGGLISGLLSHFFAPESAGVGTDAAIKAYHYGKKLSLKSSLIKLITSAITIGTGGTSGREGPIALIGAGIGSSIAEWFKLRESEKREALAIGLGSGIAAIFKAPLAGAIISAEVFFKRDFYIETMIPSFIASVISYSVFGSVYGFQPIFSANIPPFREIGISGLIAYGGLGLICALFTRIYITIFFTIGKLFKNLPLPEYIKPAVGGFLAGTIGMVIPVAIGNGYGWLQLILDGKVNDYLFTLAGAIGVILGVSFTIGSGGSGGVFGPSVMIGGLIGATYALFLNKHYNLNLHTPSFTIVGMVALFAGAAKAPLSTLILIAEMTGGYELLVPAMIAVFISYFLSGSKSIFPSQVNTRLDSPAHIDEFGLYILERLRVKDYMTPNPITIHPSSTLYEAQRIIAKNMIGGIPVANGRKLVGIITKSDINKVPEDKRKFTKVYEVMNVNVITVIEDEVLSEVLRIMSTKGIGRLPVIKDSNSKEVIGIITRADIGRAIREWGRHDNR